MDAVSSAEKFVPIYQYTRYHQKKATCVNWSCLRRGFKTNKEVRECSSKLRNYGCHNLYFLLITTVTALRRKKRERYVTHTQQRYEKCVLTLYILIVRHQSHISTQQWAQNVPSERLKRPVREADHIRPSSTESKNEYSYTNTPPYAYRPPQG